MQRVFHLGAGPVFQVDEEGVLLLEGGYVQIIGGEVLDFLVLDDHYGKDVDLLGLGPEVVAPVIGGVVDGAQVDVPWHLQLT